MVIELIVTIKTIKLLEENAEENFALGKDFMNCKRKH